MYLDYVHMIHTKNRNTDVIALGSITIRRTTALTSREFSPVWNRVSHEIPYTVGVEAVVYGGRSCGAGKPSGVAVPMASLLNHVL